MKLSDFALTVSDALKEKGADIEFSVSVANGVFTVSYQSHETFAVSSKVSGTNLEGVLDRVYKDLI